MTTTAEKEENLLSPEEQEALAEILYYYESPYGGLGGWEIVSRVLSESYVSFDMERSEWNNDDDWKGYLELTAKKISYHDFRSVCALTEADPKRYFFETLWLQGVAVQCFPDPSHQFGDYVFELKNLSGYYSFTYRYWNDMDR